MNKLLFVAILAMVTACNNSKKEKDTAVENKTTNTGTSSDNPPPPATDYAPTSNLTYSADGKEISHTASLLVTKDKDNLQAGAPFLCMLTSNNAANNDETLTVNFLLDTKPGTYPVVGASFLRGKDPKSEMYGGILGGKPKITEYKVTITECRDMGDNSMGGHRWSLSGYWEAMTIKATPIMLLDKTRNHPAEVQLGKGTFTNLSFEDNMEEMMKKVMDKMNK